MFIQGLTLANFDPLALAKLDTKPLPVVTGEVGTSIHTTYLIRVISYFVIFIIS